MRYIVDRFDPSMVKSDYYRCIVHKLNHAEFMNSAVMLPAEESISDEGLAELLGFAHSRKRNEFKIGDDVLVVYTNRKVNLDAVDQFTNFKYYLITIEEA